MPDNNPAPAQSETHPYQKLGGWLLLNIVSLILGLLLDAALQWKGTGDAGIRGTSGLLLWIATYILVGSIAVQITCVVMIFYRDPRFLRFYQLGWIISFVSILFSTASIIANNLSDLTAAISGIGGMAGGLVFSLSRYLAWFAYYTRSVRVRTYMGSDEYLRRAYFTKKIKGPQPAVPDATQIEA